VNRCSRFSVSTKKTPSGTMLGCYILCSDRTIYYDPRGAYIGINVYAMTQMGGIYGPK
jgi:hypothetical protein